MSENIQGIQHGEEFKIKFSNILKISVNDAQIEDDQIPYEKRLEYEQEYQPRIQKLYEDLDLMNKDEKFSIETIYNDFIYDDESIIFGILFNYKDDYKLYLARFTEFLLCRTSRMCNININNDQLLNILATFREETQNKILCKIAKKHYIPYDDYTKKIIKYFNEKIGEKEKECENILLKLREDKSKELDSLFWHSSVFDI